MEEQGTINYMGLDGFAWFVGVVEDRNDPEQLGRVRVRCLGWHTEDLTSLPTGNLPWAHVMHPVTDPSMHGMGTTPSFLLEGGWVVGFFRDTEYQQPVIIGTLPGVPVDPADFRKGFNDPRHKKSTQVNFANKKQYAKEDKDGEVYNPGESGGTIEDYNPAYSQQSYGPYPLGAFVNGEDDKEGVFSRSSGHTVGESDTNRLARNDTGKAHAVVSTKNAAKTSSVPVANSSTTWNEPDSPYAATYPYNHVFETESGHIKEFDDTSGQERIHEYHTKGTFYEIDKDGNKVTRVVGDNYELIAGTNFVNVKGDVNLTIDSNCNTLIKKDWNIQVDGNKTEVIKGTFNQTVEKAVTETFKSTQTTTADDNITIIGKRIDLNPDD